MVLQSWKLIRRLFFLSPLPPYTMLAGLCRSSEPCSDLGGLETGGGGGVKIVINMRNISLANGNFQEFVIIFKKSTDIFSMIV